MIYTATAKTPLGIWQVAVDTSADDARHDLRLAAAVEAQNCHIGQIMLYDLRRTTRKTTFWNPDFHPVRGCWKMENGERQHWAFSKFVKW